MRNPGFSSRLGDRPSAAPTAEEFVAAIRGHLARGIRHESLSGAPLTTARAVLEVLVRDGFVVVRSSECEREFST